MNKFCPICNKLPISSPNGVCISCYQHLKRDEVPSYEQVVESCKKRLFRSFPNATQETLEKNIESSMKFHKESWESMVKNGLKAVYLAVIVVDEAAHLPTWKEWHKRRIGFISDLISLLPDRLFEPASREQINQYMKHAIDYWDGKLSEEDRETIYNEFKILIDKKTNNSTWDEKSLPLWMMQKEEFFNWMWYQFMDCIYECISEEYNLGDDQWMGLFQKHFSDVLSHWVSEL